MANIVRNTLTVTGANVEEVLKATTRRYTETEEGWRIEPNGPVVAYFSDDCVTLPSHRRKQRTVVFPDQQMVFIKNNEIVFDFESKWSGPIWEVQEVSRQFPALTFTLWGWDRSASYGWFYSIIAGIVTQLDMRKAWGQQKKDLAAKYQINVTSDCFYGSKETRGTILFEGVRRPWTWGGHEGDAYCTVFIKDGDTGEILRKATPPIISSNSDGTSVSYGSDEIYEAVVNELQAGPAPTPRDLDDDGDDDDPEPDEHVVVKAYSAGAGC